MNDIYVICAKRTPFGSFGGVLSEMPAPELAAQTIRHILDTTTLAPEAIDEVIIGQVLQGGAGQAPARQAMRLAGIPDSTAAMTINKVCGSGLKSIMLAADGIALGNTRIALAGGMENMSQAPYALPKARFGQRLGHGELLDLMIHDGLQDPYSKRHMGEITEELITAKGLTRDEQDAFAKRSYERAQAATANNTFAAELTPIVIKTRKGETTVAADEEPVRGAVDKLGDLRPAFSKTGTITAGNASTLSDGAGMVLLTGADTAASHNLTPLARLVAGTTNSIHPNLFAEAPVDAIRRCCSKAGLKIEDIGLFEINEAFSAVPLVAIKELGLDPERVNVNGGAVAIGHPIGASGARLVATLIREMRVRKEKYGLATLCIGGGEAVAAIFELV